MASNNTFNNPNNNQDNNNNNNNDHHTHNNNANNHHNQNNSNNNNNNGNCNRRTVNNAPSSSSSSSSCSSNSGGSGSSSNIDNNHTVEDTRDHESVSDNTARSDIAGDDIVLGTPREERLVSKLKIIDVVSQNSVAGEDNEESICLDLPENVSNLVPLNSPTLPDSSSSNNTSPAAVPSNDEHAVVSSSASNSVRPRVSTSPAASTKPNVHYVTASSGSPYSSYAHNTSTSVRHDTARQQAGNLQNRITLLVGGTRFVVHSQTFMNHPNTMLGRMFSTGMEYLKVNESGEYEVARGISANVFKIVMEYYKSGSMHCPPTVSMAELREACDYLLIPFNADIIKCQNLSELLHEVSNDGSRDKFTTHFMEELILPKMVECARRGNRECHLVILKEDDVVEWGDFKPNNGEEYAEIIHSTTLYRFFKYFENRDVAKDVLTERGLKKVKLGIEGFPTHMEKVKYKVHGKPDVIYSYIQRPFVHMSWEKEGSKSRHVDFQCVKPSKQSGGMFGAVDEPAALAPDLDLPPPGALLGGDEFANQENPEAGD